MGDIKVATMDQGAGLASGFGQIPANFTSQDPGNPSIHVLIDVKKANESQ